MAAIEALGASVRASDSVTSTDEGLKKYLFHHNSYYFQIRVIMLTRKNVNDINGLTTGREAGSELQK